MKREEAFKAAKALKSNKSSPAFNTRKKINLNFWCKLNTISL
jgi:hypothetical protein